MSGVNITVYDGKNASEAAQRAEAAAREAKEQASVTSGALTDPIPPGTESEPAVLPPGPAGQKVKFEPEPGFYQGFDEVTSDKRWYFYWNDTEWSLKELGELPEGSTVAKDWAAGTYTADQTSVKDGVLYRVKPSVVSTTGEPGISSDWEPIGKNVDLSNDYSDLNLLPNSNEGLSSIKIGESNAFDDLFSISSAAGSPIMQVDTSESLLSVKATLKIGDRANFLSAKLNTNSLKIKEDDEVHFGVYIKVPPTYTGTITVGLSNAVGNVPLSNTLNVEFVQLKGGWRYYRSTESVKIEVPSFQFFVYLNNITGGEVSELKVSSPAVAVSKTPLSVQVYPSFIKNNNLNVSFSELWSVNNNVIRDADLESQQVGSAKLSTPWVVSHGGNTAFRMPFDIVKEETPIGAIAIRGEASRRSSDNFTTDLQFYQVVKIPTSLADSSSARISMGAYVNLSDDKARVNLNITFFSTNDGSGSSLGNVSYSTVNSLFQKYNQWVFVKNEGVPIPVNAKSFRAIGRLSYVGDVLDTPTNIFITGLTCVFNKKLSQYYPNGVEKSQGGALIFAESIDRLVGKKWCSFGDSITAQNGYQTPVINRYRLTHYLRGIGGSGVSNNETLIAWVDANGAYITRPPAAPPAGVEGVDYFTIKSQGYQQERIDTIPLDTDIITVMMGTNDMAYTTGDRNDAPGDNTFFGRYKQMLDRMYERVPNAEIVLLTPSYLASEDSWNPLAYETQ